MPLNGWPIMLPLVTSWQYRPSISIVSVEVDCSTSAGCDGFICDVTFAFHSPAIFFSISCWGPGVAALVIFSIIACCSAVILGGASAAKAAVQTNSATAASAIHFFMGDLLVGT